MPGPAPEFEVKSYRYYFKSYPPDPHIPDEDRLDEICLFDDRDIMRAALRFQRDPGPLPPHLPRAAACYIAYFWRSDMPGIIDMLRNEKPVNFRFSESIAGLHRALLYSGKPEPVGEGEPAR
jgi:hypothetical protein